MRWRYYFQVIVSGTLLNLYYYTGIFDKTGAVLQAKTSHLQTMGTSTFTSRLDHKYSTFGNSFAGDNSIEQRGPQRNEDGSFQFPSPSQRLNITHATVDSDARARIRNYTQPPEGTESQQPLSPKHFERYAGERLVAIGSLFGELMRYR